MIYKAAHLITISGDPIKQGEILIKDGIICDLGVGLSKKYPDEPISDYNNCAILPGFVNAHSHVDYTWSRNQYDALNLWDWIGRVGYKSGRQPDYNAALDSAIYGSAECACSGITCLGDSTFTGAAAEAMSLIGLRGTAYCELFGQSMGDNYVQDYAIMLDNIYALKTKSSAIVGVGLSPHTVYTSNMEVLELCAGSCADKGIPIALHLAETHAEADYTMYGTGPIAEWRKRLDRPPMITGLSPTLTLQKSGLLRKGVSLAHCVHVSDEEIELIAHSGASVVHCPRSNAYLGCGIAPATKFMAAGAAVGLGTDSEGSCMRFDFFEEMRFALAIARANRQDAAALTANDILRLATIGGAETLGLDKLVGTIEVGKRADIIAIDLSDTLPDEDLFLAVISRSPSDVTMVMVDGVEIVKGGRPVKIDMDEYKSKLSARSS
ncbi:amidohydrolase family protein [bacterium]|nr:amidohydrolase family protein [bacterium]